MSALEAWRLWRLWRPWRLWRLAYLKIHFQIDLSIVDYSKVDCQYDECSAAKNSGCSDAGKLEPLLHLLLRLLIRILLHLHLLHPQISSPHFSSFSSPTQSQQNPSAHLICFHSHLSLHSSSSFPLTSITLKFVVIDDLFSLQNSNLSAPSPPQLQLSTEV